LADRVIDCTGDADVAYLAGAEYRYVYSQFFPRDQFLKMDIKLKVMALFKGQLIPKAKFKVFYLNQKSTKIFLYYCPSFKKPLKSV
jgi:hypothetical protein